jgi:LPXTG-site transpeptidase (sortase) family protein
MSSSRTTDLTIEQLEALVRLKQRRITEEKVARFALAEVQYPTIYETAEGIESELPRRVHSPESWRGAQGRDRYFRSLAPLPLDGAPSYHQGDRVGKQTQPASRVSSQRPSGVGRRRLAQLSWRDGLLIALEGVALVGFMAILGFSYLQLQALNREAREAQRAALTRIVLSPTAALGSDEPERALATRVGAGILAPTTNPMASSTHTPVPREPSVADGSAAAMTHTPTWWDVSSTATRAITPLAHLLEQTESADETVRESTGEAALGLLPLAPGEPSEAVLGAAFPLMIEDVLGDRALGLPTRLVIPALAIDAPVIEGDGEQELKSGVGYRSGSALPGQPGNVILSAHNDIHGAIFRDLHKLVAGDELEVYAGETAYAYRVVSVEIVMPDRMDPMVPTDEAVVTLITCYPYLIDTHRVVVRARLVR